MSKLWTPTEVDNLIAILDARPEPTFEERCRAIAGLNGRSFNAIRAKAREMGWEIANNPGEPTSEIKREILYCEIRKLQKDLERERERSAAIEKAIAESIAALPALEVPPRKPWPKKKGDEHTAVLLISDAQIGQAFTLADVGGMGYPYGFGEFESRGQTLVKGTALLTDIWRSYAPVNNLKILFLGDMVEGYKIFRGQQAYIDSNIFKQVFRGAEVLSRMLADLSSHFKTIDAYCVWGNHGRIDKDAHDEDNFDRFFYEFVALRTKPIKNIRFFISESYGMVFTLPEIPGHNFFIWHGDNVKSYMTFPYYGLDRATAQYVQLADMPLHYFCCGHHHRKAILNMPHGELIVNGSWVGTSPFSAKEIRMGGPAIQLFIIAHPRKGIVTPMDIRLSEPFKLAKDEKGIATPYREV